MRRPGGFDGGAGGLGGDARNPGPKAGPDPGSAGASEPDAPTSIAPGPGALESDAAEPEAPVPGALERRGKSAADPVRAARQRLKRARRSVRDRERRERRRFTAHLRRRRVNWLVAGGAVAALAVFVAVGVLSPLTAVREIRVVGASKIDPDALQPALERFTGVPLALVGDGEVHRALEPFPLIQRYSIERIPPHTLLIRIEERDAVIAVKRGDRFELRDPAGVLVDRTDGRPKGVPLASGRVKDPSTPAFAAAARIVRDLPDDIRRKLVGVSASSAQDVTFELTGGRSVVWGEPAETQRKAVVLRAMLKSVKSASRIDVSSPDTPVFT